MSLNVVPKGPINIKKQSENVNLRHVLFGEREIV